METTTTPAIDISKMSASEIEALLKEKQKQEKAESLKKREAYETMRDKKVNQMIKSAIDLQAHMLRFKQKCYDYFEEAKSDAAAYGDIRKNSKGGFSLRARDTGARAALVRNVKHSYDERADMALELVKEFLETTVKKRSLQDYKAISTLIQKNKQGDLEPSRVAALLAIKDNYDDDRWIKGMQLLQEAYYVRDISMNIEFSKPNKQGKDEAIILTFSSLNIEVKDDSTGTD